MLVIAIWTESPGMSSPHIFRAAIAFQLVATQIEDGGVECYAPD